MSFQSPVNQSESTSWKSFFLLNLKSIAEGYKNIVRYWYVWIVVGPVLFFLLGLFVPRMVGPLFGVVGVAVATIINMLSLLFIYVLLHDVLRPSTMQKTWSYYRLRLGRYLKTSLQVFLIVCIIACVLIAFELLVFPLGVYIYNSWSEYGVLASINVLTPLFFIANPIYTFAILFSLDDVSFKRFIGCALHLVYRLFLALIVYLLFFGVLVVSLLYFARSMPYVFVFGLGINVMQLIIFATLPAQMITLINLYAKEVDNHSERYGVKRS